MFRQGDLTTEADFRAWCVESELRASEDHDPAQLVLLRDRGRRTRGETENLLESPSKLSFSSSSTAHARGTTGAEDPPAAKETGSEASHRSDDATA